MDEARRVLIAEDDYKYAATIARLVEALGLACVLAEDGIKAAELLEDLSQEFHLVITDFRMPRASGWWVIEAARLHRGASFPVIMQTAEAQYADVYAKAEALGVPIIAKDDIHALLAPAVREALQMGDGATGLGA
jgi:CheY-like chemotaxis protein